MEKPLIAPLSLRECVHYYIHIEEKRSSGKNSYWKTLIEESNSCNFLIHDGSSFAHISDKNIKSYIVQDRSYTSGFMNDASANLERYLHLKGYESENFLGFNKSMRYKEGVLEIGEEIAVYGKAQWKDVADLFLLEKYDKVLEITSQKDIAIYLRDDPKTTLRTAKKEHKARRKESSHKRKFR